MTHKNQNYGNDGGPRKLDKTSSHGEREAESIRDKDLVNHLQRKKINIKEHITKEKVVESLDDKNFLYIPKVYILLCYSEGHIVRIIFLINNVRYVSFGLIQPANNFDVWFGTFKI